ncbi:MAG: hypothetical protein KC635_03810, partial [Myxococcales bacterium]|nr:hypothetical protein [Myxococcales bacterium]
GGGGRIAVVASAAITGALGGASPWTMVDVRGGIGWSSDAGAGTFYRRVGGALGDLVIDNAGVTTFDGSTPFVFQGEGVATDLTATTLSDTSSVDFTALGDLRDYR